MLENDRKRAYQSAVVTLNITIHVIAAHFMYHVVFTSWSLKWFIYVEMQCSLNLGGGIGE